MVWTEIWTGFSAALLVEEAASSGGRGDKLTKKMVRTDADNSVAVTFCLRSISVFCKLVLLPAFGIRSKSR